MDIGLTIPTRGPLATREGIEAMARHAETLGFAHLSLSDHLVVPRSIDSRYPYSESGEWAGAASGDCFEQFTELAYLAAITSKVRLITAVAVIPYRAAVHSAKIIATIDVLSGGRMVLGVGAGWLREEFEALGAPPFEARGRVTDEYLQAFKTLWTEDAPRFDGEFVRFDHISFLPKPLQKSVPIWVGGESPPAMRRTARLGDVWFPIGNNPRHPLDTLRAHGSRPATPARDRRATGPRSRHHRHRLLRRLVRRDPDQNPADRRAPPDDRHARPTRRRH